MKYPAIECSECAKQFAPKNSRNLTCSEACSDARHQRLNAVRMREGNTSQYNYAAGSDMQAALAPLDALVRRQPRPARVAGWWR